MTQLIRNMKVARPYATGVFKFACQHEQLEVWSHMLQNMLAVVVDEKVACLLNNPDISKDMLLNLFFSIPINKKIKKYAENFLRLLINYHRLNVLPEIVFIFEALLEEYNKIYKVKVISAFSLTKTQKTKLILALKKRLNCKDINMTCEIDQSILGGLIVCIGNLVVDGSIKAELTKLSYYIKQR